MQLRQKINENLSQDELMSLWLINYKGFEYETASLLPLLDTEEQKRVEAYKLPEKALVFTIAHGFMRLLLSSLLQIHPEELKFFRGNYGKPYLAQAPNFAFNLSYSKQFILFGYSSIGQLGLDIELIQKLPVRRQIIEQQFHPDEKATLMSLSADDQLKKFYRIWTCKEAYLKALGRGVSLPLNSFAVDLEESASIKGQSEWVLHEFEFEHQHLAAIASNQANAPRLIRI